MFALGSGVQTALCAPVGLLSSVRSLAMLVQGLWDVNAPPEQPWISLLKWLNVGNNFKTKKNQIRPR